MLLRPENLIRVPYRPEHLLATLLWTHATSAAEGEAPSSTAADHIVFEPAAPRFTGPVVVSADIEGAAAALNLERLDAHIWARVYFDDFKRCCS
ncbi:hypothetical protein B0T11DRAFT_280734 [Plectosphaerella cucumerina]|uniref:Uncharacterized protein n=1 Tax=Plectosphaerella cucumerina TaxID=40658 RepID=A0A8K0TJ35_9PEZI|nr:hypothetical protein B0T11DRAFT_280734 [Plectosphaerella cucumerina]